MGKLLQMGIDPMRLSEQLFCEALSLEPMNIESAKTLYQRAIDVYPYNLGAIINLGTIYFNGAEFPRAEQLYRRAIAVNPDYAMAHFNLANLLERNWRKREALEHYRVAIQINADYADAYYNLAILLREMGYPMESAKHWLRYLHLDSASNWAEVARMELKKLLPVINGGRDVLAKGDF